MNDRSGTITSKNQAVVIALAVLLAVSLSAVAALVVNRVNSQRTGADIPTPAATYTPALSPAAEEVVPTSTDNQTAEAATEAQTEEAPAAIGAPAEVAPAEVAPVEVAPVEEAPVEEAPVEEDPSTEGPDLDLDFDFDVVLPCPEGFVRLESGACVPDIDFDIDVVLPCPDGLIWVNGHCVPDFGLELIQPDFDFGLIQPDFDFDFDLTDRFPGL